MQTLKELYKIGNGPSSSHTMGPKRAAILFKEKNPKADKFEIILYGSLALTGKGHLTDEIIKETLKPIETIIKFDLKEKCEIHPNTLDMIAYKNDKKIDQMRVYSVGGGTIRIEGEKENSIPDIYEYTKFEDIKVYCKENNKSLYQYVYEVEGNHKILKRSLGSYGKCNCKRT